MPITVDRIAAGFDRPIFAASPPGQPDKLYVVENTGRIEILDLATNQVAAQAFFTVPSTELSTGGERGLLGLAFHPEYAANGKVYLDLTNELGDTELWEVTRSLADPQQADPATQRVLLTVDRSAANHNGGWLGFGPDGLLYIGSGDSGGSNDPENAAQDPGDLRGKILRIDVDDDPFASEIFAFGLRNPWRASFDRATGDFYIADVGQNAREEVDFLPAGTGAGTNFGWAAMEGTLVRTADDPGFRAPIAEYGHGLDDFQGFSVTGGYVYRGPGGLQGRYFFADFVSSHLWTLRVVNGQATEFVQRDGELVVNGGTLDQIASFAEDAQGRLYALGLDGELFRFSIPEEVAGPLATGSGGESDAISGALVVAGAALALAAWFF